MIRPIFCALIALALCAPAAMPQSIQTERSKLESIKQKLEETRRKAWELKRREKREVQELTVMQRKLERTAVELEDSRFRLNRTQRQLAVTKQSLERARARFKAQQKLAADRLRGIYRHRHIDYWEALLTAPDLTQFLTRYQYFQHMIKADYAVLHELDERLAEIDDQRRRYHKQVQTIATITQTIEHKKGEIQEQTEEQAALIRRLKTERAAYEAAAAQLERDSRQIEAMIRRMLAGRRKGPRLGTGQFVWPVSGRISSTFGPRRHPIFKVVKPHHGIDFAVGHGNPIQAADHGVVLYVGWYGGYGKIVMIDHGADTVTLYAHTSRYVVSKGDKVSRGQVIAYVGSTGFSTGPHLHFEVRRNGTPVDPLGYLR